MPLYKDDILGGQWYRQPWNSNQCFWFESQRINFNILHVKQAALAMERETKRAENQTSCLIHSQQCGLQSGLFIPLILLLCSPSNLTTSQWCSTQPSSNKAQIPAFILLLHCEGLLTPPSQSSNLHARGMARSFHYESALRDTRNQKRLCWMFIHRSNFFNSRWLSPLYFSSHVEVLASHLALKPVHCKHSSGGLFPYFFFSILPIYPISSQYKYRSLS